MIQVGVKGRQLAFVVQTKHGPHGVTFEIPQALAFFAGALQSLAQAAGNSAYEVATMQVCDECKLKLARHRQKMDDAMAKAAAEYAKNGAGA